LIRPLVKIKVNYIIHILSLLVKLTGKDGEGLLEIRSFEKYEETLKNKIASKKLRILFIL